MSDDNSKSIIKRVFVPGHVRELPNGERVKVPGHYKAPSRKS